MNTNAIGFASMILLLVGSLNWGSVALNYATGSFGYPTSCAATTARGRYDCYKTPDLLETFGAGPTLQMVTYWAVLVAGATYVGMFVYQSAGKSDGEKAGPIEYLGISSMVLLVVGAINWGAVAMNYAFDNLKDFETACVLAPGEHHHHEYKCHPVPDLLRIMKFGPVPQMIVYWLVFAAGVVYIGLFVFQSMKVVEETA